MTDAHLQDLISSSSTHTLYKTLNDKINQSAIVNVRTVSGDCIKIKGDKDTYVLDITPDYITVAFDSHISDIMYVNIECIEYFGGLYGRNNIKKIEK